MTCVAGVIRNGAVHMAGDSAASQRKEIHVRVTPKVFRLGAYVVGCAGSFRLADLIRYHVVPLPPPPQPNQLHRHIATMVVESVRQVMAARGHASIEDSRESMDGDLLIGVRGRLFVIERDYQVGEPLGTYTAIGSGQDLALGALSALGDRCPPKRRLTAALTAAATYNTAVRPPFHFLTLRPTRR